MLIVHILKTTEWEESKKRSIYEADTLETQGFIHCSNIDQIVSVANFNYKAEIDMKMLIINTELLESEVKYEDLYDEGKEYPHIYGPINLDSIEEIIDFPCKEDGTFELPMQAKKYL